MGEPYDTRDCPLCGSDRTQSYSARTRAQIGYGAVCLDCGLTWDFTGDDEPSPGPGHT